MTESPPNQNPSNESLSNAEREALGIDLAEEITALGQEGSEEAIQKATVKARELEKLFAPSSLPTPEVKLYDDTAVMLESGETILIKKDRFQFDKEGKTINLFPNGTFTFGGNKVAFGGQISENEPNKALQGKFALKLNPERQDEALYVLVTLDEIKEKGDDFWSFEILTQEKIREQYDSQLEAYLAVGLIEIKPNGWIGFIEDGHEYPFPSIDQVSEYLQNDPEFTEIARKKEKQGFENILITPFGMDIKRMQDIIQAKIIERGGAVNSYGTADWKYQSKMLYFTELNTKGEITGGVTKQAIKKNGNILLNGAYMVSLTEKSLQIPHKDSPDESIGGRTRIKAGKTAIDFQKVFQTEMYLGEDSMLPEEWLALFAQDLNERYIKHNKQIEQDNTSQLLDFNSWCWFVRNKFASGIVPLAYWYPGGRKVNLYGDSVSDSYDFLGVRSSVRKRLRL